MVWLALRVREDGKREGRVQKKTLSNSCGAFSAKHDVTMLRTGLYVVVHGQTDSRETNGPTNTLASTNTQRGCHPAAT